MTVIIPPPICQLCGHHATKHGPKGCRFIFRLLDDELVSEWDEPCGCSRYRPPRDDSKEIARLRDQGFRV